MLLYSFAWDSSILFKVKYLMDDFLEGRMRINIEGVGNQSKS
jgi:hypothetical protein